MVGPSPLTIATSSVNRLLKEEASYHKEQDQQEKRIQRLQEGNNDDENAEFQLKQEVRPGEWIFHSWSALTLSSNAGWRRPKLSFRR